MSALYLSKSLLFTSASVTMYAISFPFSSYFAKSVNVYSQFSFSVITSSAIIAFPFFTCTFMLSGLYPFSLLLSSHTFATISVTFSFGTVNVFVIVFPLTYFL